jgi:hypothetical protein
VLSPGPHGLGSSVTSEPSFVLNANLKLHFTDHELKFCIFATARVTANLLKAGIGTRRTCIWRNTQFVTVAQMIAFYCECGIEREAVSQL